VDYVVVRNPAKNPTRMFDGSGLQSILKEWGGAEITMPACSRARFCNWTSWRRGTGGASHGRKPLATAI
jgi:hypothetical protein